MNTTFTSEAAADLQEQDVTEFMDTARRECKSMEDVLALVQAFDEYQYFLMNWDRATA